MNRRLSLGGRAVKGELAMRQTKNAKLAAKGRLGESPEVPPAPLLTCWHLGSRRHEGQRGRFPERLRRSPVSHRVVDKFRLLEATPRPFSYAE